MVNHIDMSDHTLFRLLKAGDLHFAGNKRLKIYGRLHCGSGKRMSEKNRVFFTSEEEALLAGFRPCGNCMREAYMNWKNGIV